MVNVVVKGWSVTNKEVPLNENEILKKELVYFIKKYMEFRELLVEGLSLIERLEEELNKEKDKTFWEDEVRRLCKEGCEYKDALEIVKLSKEIRDIYRRKENEHCKRGNIQRNSSNTCSFCD